MAVRALRGATTVAADTPEQITERTQEMLLELLSQNELVVDDVISVLFTATEDIVSMFPAAAARGVGFGAVPLICAREIPVKGSTPLCLRVMLHVETTRDRDTIHHVYLHGAQGLRDDLPR